MAFYRSNLPGPFIATIYIRCPRQLPSITSVAECVCDADATDPMEQVRAAD